MHPELAHERLDVYRLYLEVAGLCGGIGASMTDPIAAIDHLDRAMESIGVNLMRANAQVLGSSLRSSCLDVSIASTHECAAALDVCLAKGAIGADTCAAGTGRLWRIRGMLLGLKRASLGHVQEEQTQYGTPRFPHASLDMYQASLEGVRWTHILLEELASGRKAGRKLDVSTTGTVLNIAEGHGRASTADRNRFMKIAQEHALQTVLLLDLMVARHETPECRIAGGKAIQARVISMLHAWGNRKQRTRDSRG